MNGSSSELAILQRARCGDVEAIGYLVNRYRSRLKMLIAVRIDRRLVQRIDDSDVLQELFLRLNQSRSLQKSQPIKLSDPPKSQDLGVGGKVVDELTGLPDFPPCNSSSGPPDGVSTYVWLRRLALWTLAEMQRKHLGVQQRDPRREFPFSASGSVSSFGLAAMFIVSDTRPLDAMVREERSNELARTLEEMDPIDREILTLRHCEQLSRSEAAEILGISVAAAAKRYMRALQRVREKMKGWEE